jgi:hypothetical protein
VTKSQQAYSAWVDECPVINFADIQTAAAE